MRRRLAALAGTTVALALAASPAAAYLRDVEALQPRVVSHNGRPLTLTCPSAKFLLGMGADINAVASTGGIGLSRMSMSDGRADRAELSSVDTDAGRSTWGISGQLFCAGYTDTPPTAATGGPYLKNVVVDSAAAGYSSVSPRTTSISCGTRRPIGGGFSLLGPEVAGIRRPGAPPHVVVDAVKTLSANLFVVVARETQPTSANWALETFVVCANYTEATPGAGYIGPGPLIYTDTTLANSANKTTSAVCPSGFNVIGGGARILPAGPTGAPPPQVVLTESFPLPRLGNRLAAWTATGAEENPTTASWRLQARVVCGSFVFP